MSEQTKNQESNKTMSTAIYRGVTILEVKTTGVIFYIYERPFYFDTLAEAKECIDDLYESVLAKQK